MDYTLHGILQARIMERVAFPFSRRSSQPRGRTQVSHVAGRFFTSWATSYICICICICVYIYIYIYSQSCGFLVIIYGCKSWTIKKAEHWKIDAFELWCWRRLLRVPWTARKSNQSILKEISPECSLEGLMLKLQYFGHLMWRANSLEKTSMLGKIEGRRGRGCHRMRLLDGIIDTTDLNMSKLRETVKDRETWHAAVHGVAESWTWLSEWTATATKDSVNSG